MTARRGRLKRLGPASEPRRLADWHRAPARFGFYEIGFKKSVFDARYGGRAAGTTLHQRLRAHFTHSHNPWIRRDRDRLWYRYWELDSSPDARLAEAVMLLAHEYEWNERYEWREWWALDR